MPHGFRPLLEPPSHRRGDLARRPCLCVAMTLGVSLFVSVVFGMSAWNIFHNRFDNNLHFFHRGDEVSLAEVTRDLSSIFCDKYEVSSPTSGHVYFLPRRAVVNNTIVDTTTVSLHQFPNKEFNVKTAYLLHDSVIDVTACRENGSRETSAHITLIRGKSNFKTWRHNSECASCTVQRVRIPVTATCDDRKENGQGWAKLNHTVARNNNYYLVVFYGIPTRRHRQRGQRGIFLNGTLLRTHFDTSGAEDDCELGNGSDCVFDLPWSSEKDAVVRLGEENRGNFREVFTTKCHARLVFWISVFGVSPVVCIILASIVLACVLCRRTRRNFNAVVRYGATSSRRAEEKAHKAEEYTTSKTVEQAEGGNMAIQDG